VIRALEFFNQENIAKIWFEGYVDDFEELLQQKFEEERENIKYTRLKLSE